MGAKGSELCPAPKCSGHTCGSGAEVHHVGHWETCGTNPASLRIPALTFWVVVGLCLLVPCGWVGQED